MAPKAPAKPISINWVLPPCPTLATAAPLPSLRSSHLGEGSKGEGTAGKDVGVGRLGLGRLGLVRVRVGRVGVVRLELAVR